jgi:hypothetical protein
MINDNYQKELEKDLIKIYRGLKKNIDINILDKLKKENENFKIYDNEKQSLIEYNIFNNKVSVDELHILNYRKKKDDRLEQLLSLIQKTIDYVVKNNLNVPDTTLFIWISDRFPYTIENIENFPVYVFARPINVKLPIFPDNTFECLSLDEKYSDQCNDWDYLKKLIVNKCQKKTKKKQLYFKGTATTLNNSQIREKLEIISLVNQQISKYGKINNKFIEYIKPKINKIKDKSFYNYILSEYQKKYTNLPVNVNLDAWKNYKPVYKMCDYKYLLNLPGHYQWSNRLKYLFLMKSHIININVKLISTTYTDEKYISFIDYIVNKNDYEEIVLKYYRQNQNLTVKTNELYMKKNSIEFDKFINKLSEIYAKLEKKSNGKINSGFNKINKLTNERIYHYIYTAILLNAELFNNMKNKK